ncbi:hypothetical protein HMPREF9997_00118 [Corynebacterium durum F0235]|uniref:Uncharacterized protein n=1 Tax=Corynebacterium durum F0235 TaxID=1035195 RepID=L1MMJ1_9CORY|nr:hypothetical protein HMPREF9997_00118 [Corynebacterium durum F0235]
MIAVLMVSSVLDWRYRHQGCAGQKAERSGQYVSDFWGVGW